MGKNRGVFQAWLFRFGQMKLQVAQGSGIEVGRLQFHLLDTELCSLDYVCLRFTQLPLNFIDHLETASLVY